MAIVMALVSLLTTLLGGVVAMRVRDRRHLVLGLAGGLILGVAAFDLLPESLKLSSLHVLRVDAPMVGFAAGFLLLHVIEQLSAIHQAHENEYAPHRHPHGHGHPGGAGGHVGILAACALVGHSMVDGLSIGLGYQSGGDVGLFVALAVIAHDFADGFNTFTAASLNRADRRPAVVLLIMDACAPVVGAALTLLISVPKSVLGIYLGFFAGILLYLAAGEILPEAHSRHPRVLTLCCTGAGLLAVMGIMSLGE
ncbi:ZIP family metal transporter [Actinomadura rupiterrae]|uniref:ZIP family metal transporter n=1 Tax=Actinomadura rupiterrae TaxID=559627 RepID=UPI0020A43DB1|nr:ZIP family metal transporter [Actinomadura rupiterrae]MCP2337751.1 ZIP family zinc transporter [Actinomadura rupiterrae]